MVQRELPVRPRTRTSLCLGNDGERGQVAQKMKMESGRRDTRKGCPFHSDHGHHTEDCVALRMQVNDLIKRRHLKEFLSDKARNLPSSHNVGQESAGEKPEFPPKQDRVVNVISGGSDVSGISHLATKRNTRVARNFRGP
ncbi:unnamed protein product [Cochlearia groenlandica]